MSVGGGKRRLRVSVVFFFLFLLLVGLAGVSVDDEGCVIILCRERKCTERTETK